MKTLHAEKHVVHVLHDLMEMCKNGEKGFQGASKGVKSQDLKTLFQTISMHRSRLVPDLQEEVERLGGTPERLGSILGALHRGWMNIKSAIATRNDNVIITECERGEDAARAAYEEALKEKLPSRTRKIIESQYMLKSGKHMTIYALGKRRIKISSIYLICS